MGQAAITHRNDGAVDNPRDAESWFSWVAATDTRNFCAHDTLLDWLDNYGEKKGFIPDHKRPAYEPRTDFLKFMFRKAREFETAVISGLERSVSLIKIESGASRDLAATNATWEAMLNGADAIYHAVLRNPETRTFGTADLLLRSDVLAKLFPSSLPKETISKPAPGLKGSKWHYRVVEIKYTTLDILAGGQISSSELPYIIQAWIYNEALGRLQEYLPDTACLLGRSWKDKDGRGSSCMERLASVKCAGAIGKKGDAAAIAQEACAWIRDMRTKGAAWEVLPTPSVPQLYPNMKNSDKDQPWHLAKKEIATQLNELTLLPQVNVTGRNTALRQGIKSWRDEKCTSSALSVTGPKMAPLLDRIIESNRAVKNTLFPDSVKVNEHLWRDPAPLEFFVDFETVNDLDDDFSKFPFKGGLNAIFMIGCGYLEKKNDQSSWRFKIFCTKTLNTSEEMRIIQEWVSFMEGVAKERGIPLAGNSRLFHWTAAELSMLENAYNSAKSRHGKAWPDFSWVDLCSRVIKEEPVTVSGAFGFGLKEIAKPMHKHGFINTSWTDGPMDGLGATVGAWFCNAEASKNGTSMVDIDLMHDITKYNEVDCKVMMEILEYLRRNR